MKKKLMLLAIGAMGICSSAFSQLNVNENINGNIVTGTITNVNPNQTLAIGTQVTFVSTPGNIQYTYTVVLTPSSNPTPMTSDIANAINNTFNANTVSGSAVGGTAVNRFGSNAGEYSVSFVRSNAVPFDLGLSAVLAAGAVGAVRTARSRKKAQAELA